MITIDDGKKMLSFPRKEFMPAKTGLTGDGLMYEKKSGIAFVCVGIR